MESLEKSLGETQRETDRWTERGKETRLGQESPHRHGESYEIKRGEQ